MRIHCKTFTSAHKFKHSFKHSSYLQSRGGSLCLVFFSGRVGRGTASPSWRAERGTGREGPGGRPKACGVCEAAEWGARGWESERRGGCRPAEGCGCCCSTSPGRTAPTGADWRRERRRGEKNGHVLVQAGFKIRDNQIIFKTIMKYDLHLRRNVETSSSQLAINFLWPMMDTKKLTA